MKQKNKGNVPGCPTSRITKPMKYDDTSPRENNMWPFPRHKQRQVMKVGLGLPSSPKKIQWLGRKGEGRVEEESGKGKGGGRREEGEGRQKKNK